MINRRTKAAQFVAAIIAFSAVLIGGVWLFVTDGQPWIALFWSLVWGIAVVTTLVAFIGFLRETATEPRPEDYRRVLPPNSPLPPAPDRKHPWPAEWLAPAFASAFEGTPYTVTSNGHAILIHVDLADARWQHVATRHCLQASFVTHFTPTAKPGVIKRTDESRRVERERGVHRLGAQVAVQSGRQWGYTRRVEYGLGVDGFKKRVDYEFSTNEINEPVKEVLTRAGWRTTLDAESKGALIMAGIGGSAVVIVPIAFLVKSLLN